MRALEFSIKGTLPELSYHVAILIIRTS